METINVKNLTLDYYLKSYEISLGVTDIYDLKVTDETGEALQTSLQTGEDNTAINIVLDKRNVGLGTTSSIILTYNTSSLSQKKGFIWEILVPKLKEAENITDFRISLNVPKSFGIPDTASSSVNDTSYIYFFSKTDLLENGKILNFGKEQIYDFDIEYVLKNPNLFSQSDSITLPPDIEGVQSIYFEMIEPTPKEIKIDGDGNTLAFYDVNGTKVLKPRVKGQVKVFSLVNNRTSNFSFPPSQADTGPDQYWQTEAQEIIQTANSLTNIKDIYDFVLNHIEYKKLLTENFSGRVGALAALSQKIGVCTEFSDLFVALSRAKNIPAQALEGYAYTTENSISQLDAITVLHSWARYWDNNFGWRYVDPTWGNTTSGLDYFNKFDTNHIIFAIKGDSSTIPYSAGSYIEGEENLKDNVKVTLATNDNTASMETLSQVSSSLLEAQNTKKQNFSKLFLIAGLLGSLFVLLIVAILLQKLFFRPSPRPQDQALKSNQQI